MASTGGTATAATPAPASRLLESKLTAPARLAGSVPRNDLIDTLRDARATPIVLVSAPPGYGKTTLLAQWALRSRRPFAWVTLDEGDNDPIVLLGYVAAALDRIRPLSPELFETLSSVDVPIEATAVPLLAAALAAAEPGFVLVLDDLQEVRNPRCWDAISLLADHVPDGARLVKAGQIEPSRRIGKLRASGRALEIGVDDLRMSDDEARELLRAAGTSLPDAELTELVERTEGWPAGLYLAALSIRAGGRVPAFRGDDRFVADYLRSELLARLPARQLQFLSRTSVLERMSPRLCDAVLDSGGSARTLESLERSNLFVVPLDPNREWYRYHRLFRELLRAELERAEPDLPPQLLALASEWCDANGQPEAAVGYAQEAGDADRVAELIQSHGQALYQHGRAVTVESWLSWTETHGGLERKPIVAVLGAWFSAIRGRSAEAERWAAVAERGLLVDIPDDERRLVEAWLAVIRAARCRQGIPRMKADAEAAARTFGRASPWWATAALLLATSYRLEGDDDRADDLFVDVADTAEATGGWGAASLALAHRASLAIERDDWTEAESLADQAAGVVRRSRMEDYPPNALVHAVCARVAAHRREPARAEQLLAGANRLRPKLTHVVAVYAIQTRLELARTYAALADAAGARTLLRETGALLRRGTDFGALSAAADDLRARLESARAEAPGASTLTTAELRLLPLLSTHLSFPELGERLFLSRHTVKSQAMSIYRKLDVTSRTAAVDRARELGLL